MENREKNKEAEQLVKSIVAGIQEKKGRAISILNMEQLDDAVCDYMVVAEANTPIQLDAIENAVVDVTKKQLGDRPQYVHRGDGRWIALDYISVMVHLMTPELRDYYGIEQLWADADIQHLPEMN